MKLVSLFKDVIKEQGAALGVLDALADPSNLGLNVDTDAKVTPCLKPNPDKNKVYQLFTYCNKIPVGQPTPKIKQWNDRLYNAMKGLGTNGDINKVLSELTSINDLSNIVRTFKYENESLLQWMNGEMGINWGSIWKSIPNNVKSVAKIPECLQYDKSMTA